MKFLLGSWHCVSHSERRGAETSTANLTYSMSPDGYFMKVDSASPKVSYAAVGYTGSSSMTYDTDTKRWVNVSLGSYGSYQFETSQGWKNNMLLWRDESFAPNGDWTSTTGTLYTKVSDNEYTTASAFTTEAGLVNRVNGTCKRG